MALRKGINILECPSRGKFLGIIAAANQKREEGASILSRLPVQGIYNREIVSKSKIKKKNQTERGGTNLRIPLVRKKRKSIRRPLPTKTSHEGNIRRIFQGLPVEEHQNGLISTDTNVLWAEGKGERG